MDIAFVSRNLRVAVAEWYAWLSDKSIRQDEWRGVPHWCKQIPARLDIPWALFELEKHVHRKPMIRALFVVVDEVYMSSQSMENVPDISPLRDELLKWHEEHYG